MKRTAVAMLLMVSTAASAAGHKPRGPIDADEAYKNQCMRCHTALPVYSPRMNKTVIMHMRQAANIPADEAAAILRYLNGTDLDPTSSNTPAPSPSTH